MTHEKWIALTPEQQRIKVADLSDGWQECTETQAQDAWAESDTPIQYLFGTPRKWITIDRKARMSWSPLLRYRKSPDYLHDLNAIHEVEEKAFFSDVLWHRHYSRKVQEIVTRDFNESMGAVATSTNPKEAGWFCWWLGTHATAAQRAEAFVLTMEKQ
jgi:hypothetical protein